MKCDTPAFASVSSREPAPIQKPIATERTLGTRSEMTRSPESSSDRTYFCTIPPLSRPEGLAQGRNELSVRFEQGIDEIVDLCQREFRGSVRVQHRSVVDVLPSPGQGGLDRELLDV